MKLIIAGSRDYFPSENSIIRFLVEKNIPKVKELVCGMCSGVDMCGKNWADNYEIPIKEFPADWKTHGKAAGPIRNKEMAKYADALLLIWDGKSRGSANMKQEMKKLNKPIYEVFIKKD